MKASSLNDIKKELEHKNNEELLSYCMKLAKFKKENKEFLTFLLFEESDLATYIDNIKNETTRHFEDINFSNVYFVKKSLRKILKYVNKQIKFVSSKQAEAEILIHFCNAIIDYSLPLSKSKQLLNLYEAQLGKVSSVLSTLHPDLQYDLEKQLKKR
ncbi:MAG TPA: hypothetical protein VIJ92_02750 [Ginsengibacter sp.]